MGLKIFSHNVQGINSPIKRNKAFKHYKRLGANIILLQETHFSTTNHPQYFDKTYSQFYYTTFSSKARGVAIFIRNSIVFDIWELYNDVDSRFIIIKGQINDKPLTISSIYAPNESQSIFFSTLLDIVDCHNSTHTILGGDFNLAAHPALDRSRVAPSSKAFSNPINRSLNKF